MLRGGVVVAVEEEEEHRSAAERPFSCRLVMSGCILNSANHIPLWTLN